VKGLKRLALNPFHDVMAGLSHIMLGPKTGKATAVMIVSLVACWFVYVPIHELLHVAGCAVTGGTVKELQVDPMYGGALLAKWFPFVKVGGDYAGRLTGFDTHGSDLVYLATDFGPFVLTILVGVPLVLLSTRQRRPILFAIGVVVGLAPIYQLAWDYFEMGSIIVTGLPAWILGGSVPFQALRSDDVFRLLGEIFSGAAKIEPYTPVRVCAALILILLSQCLAIVLALLTYAVGRWFGRLAVGGQIATAIHYRTLI
jgi:hypothetical protein